MSKPKIVQVVHPVTLRPRTAIPRTQVAQSSAGDELVTRQSEKKNCDINWIVDRYQKTGIVEHINKNQARYGEVPALEFRQALELVQEAQGLFEGLPSRVRARFSNDPAQFLEFCQDPANREEAVLLGLANPPATPVADPPTTTAPAAS